MKIIKLNKMSSPESSSSVALQTTSSQSAEASKRRKVPGKEKGKCKGKKISESKYVCGVCSEMILKGRNGYSVMTFIFGFTEHVKCQ